MPFGSGVRSALRRFRREEEAVKYENVYLPAKELRFCTAEWQDDRFFVHSAERDVERLVELCGLKSEGALLDIGSGQGRLAIGLVRKIPDIRRYLGVDVDLSSVSWCRKYIAKYHSNFAFERIDIQNARYNPSGQPITGAFRLPCQDGEFTVVFLYSVFTHMLTSDVAAYLSEIRRVLRPGGRVLMTVYVEEGVPDVEENPPEYLSHLGPSARPLHRVRFKRDFFIDLIKTAGLSLVRLDYQCETATAQSVLVAERVN